MLGQRLIRWPNINSALAQPVVFSGYQDPVQKSDLLKTAVGDGNSPVTASAGLISTQCWASVVDAGPALCGCCAVGRVWR